MASSPAEFFDGKTAASHSVELAFLPGGLQITDTEKRSRQIWRFADLERISKPDKSRPLRIGHRSHRGARLIIPLGQTCDTILSRAPHLAQRVNYHRLIRTASVVAICLGIAGLVGHGVLNYAPDRIARMLPIEFRENLADSTERSVLGGRKQCNAGAGVRALNRLAGRLIAASDNAPDFSVRIFKLPVINAFALPGGRIVITDKLLKTSANPTEVAGVLAHELGHVALLHPEAALVRVLGLQLLVSVATGGSGGDSISGIASLLTMLRYTRKGERQADAYAQALLEKARIDPAGLKHFFERLSDTSPGKRPGEATGKSLTDKLKGLADIFSTHPGFEERIDALKPLPEGMATEVISQREWRALKAICGGTSTFPEKPV